MHPRGSVLPLALLWALPVATLAACGDGAPVTESAASDRALHLAKGEGRHPGAGAAGDVVVCNNWGDGGAFHGEVYAEGATADDPAAALETAYSEGLSFSVPRDLELTAETDDRALYTAEVDGVPKAAVIVHDGEGTEGAGGDGWYVESWAACDVVELPAGFVEKVGYEVWSDVDGEIVPTSRLQVFRGAEHCDWQDMTFLSLGRSEDDAPTFVRKPHAELGRHFAEPFQAHTTLPADAVDSGFRHGTDRLWLAPDRTRAYVGASPDDVELWPRMVERLGCD